MKSNSKQVQLKGYEFFGSYRTGKKGGGVGILINNKLKYKDWPDLKISTDNFENVSLELLSKGKHIVVSSLYRPPNTNQTDFINSSKQLSNKIGTQEWIVGLDHNMDFLKAEKNKGMHEFLECLLELERYPLITRPTWISRDTATLIDNIIVSQALYSYASSAVLINDMSDHMRCVSVIKEQKSGKGEMVTLTWHNMKGENISKIKSDLNWTTILDGKNVNEQFDLFHGTLLKSMDNHCPEKTREVSSKKLIKEPWLFKGLLNCIKRQKKLYQDFLENRSIANQEKYKAYQNTLQRILKNTKIQYFCTQCVNFKQNSKKLWGLINNISRKSTDKSTLI